MIEEHEKQIQERMMEVERLYAHVTSERREVKHLQEDITEQKLALCKFLEEFNKQIAAREMGVASLHQRVDEEWRQLLQLQGQFNQQALAQSKQAENQKAQMTEARRLLEHVEGARENLREVEGTSTRQMNFLRDVFRTVWDFVERNNAV